MLNRILALALLSTTMQAAAAPAAATPASPTCNGAADYHQLDFWIGDWDTFESDTPGGPSVARTRIDVIAQGCAIHELYEQTDGLIGDSILSYDPVRKHWQQTWVTNRGGIMVITGNFKDGALVLEGEAHLKDGRSVLQAHYLEGAGQGRARVRGAFKRRRQDLGAGVRCVVSETQMSGNWTTTPISRRSW